MKHQRAETIHVTAKCRILLILTVVIASGSAVNAFNLPAWSDIFTSLKPYKDSTNNADANTRSDHSAEMSEEDVLFDELRLLEEGEPRYGLVQLGSGQTYNVTINLTGHILFALGVSASLLIYMFLSSLKDDDAAVPSYGSESYGYNSKKGIWTRKGYRYKLGYGTTHNVTLNLTGHILLAIGIATSLLIYMFLSSFNEDKGDGGYSAPSSGYGQRYGQYRSRTRFRSKLGTGSGTAYNVTLNLTGHILMAIGISLYLLMYMWFQAISGSGSSGYGYARKFRKKLAGSGTAYNVTLNLTGSILMGLGISLALLIYLFTNAMDSQSSGGKPSGGGYGDNYRSIVKRSSEEFDYDEEVMELLQNVIESLDQEQVEELLSQFEYELRSKSAKGVEVSEECIIKFVCQMLVQNYSSDDSATEGLRKARLITLLKENAGISNLTYDKASLYFKNALSLEPYSLYEWGKVIKLLLGFQFGGHLDGINVVTSHIPSQLSFKNNHNRSQYLSTEKRSGNSMSRRLSKLFEVHTFVETLQTSTIYSSTGGLMYDYSTSNITSKTTSDLEDRCLDHYSGCSLRLPQIINADSTK